MAINTMDNDFFTIVIFDQSKTNSQNFKYNVDQAKAAARHFRDVSDIFRRFSPRINLEQGI
jgi:hypothetical protein